jgi:hypothetical protein
MEFGWVCAALVAGLPVKILWRLGRMAGWVTRLV